MLHYKFYIDQRRNSTLMLRLTNNRRKCEISMGVQWTERELEDALSTDGRSRAVDKRSYLQRRIAMLDHLKLELQEDNRADERVEVIRELAYERLFGRPSRSLNADRQGRFYAFFVEHMGRYDRPKTRATYDYTLALMKRHMGGVERLQFDDVSYGWLSDFESKMKGAGLSQNTQKIVLGNIRTVMREAYKRGLTECDPFRRFAVKSGRPWKRAMSVERLRDLFTCEVEEHCVFYRDMMKLIFMFRGINAADLYGLSGVTAEGRVEFARSKTGEPVSVKVEPEAMEIMRRWKGKKGLLCIADRWSDPDNFRLQMNHEIKRIGIARGKGRKDAEGVGRFDDVSSYWMRHTWASVAAELEIPDATISLGLGHAGGGFSRIADIYISRNRQKVDAANRKVLDWVLYGKRDDVAEMSEPTQEESSAEAAEKE